jgi:KTSC domain
MMRLDPVESSMLAAIGYDPTLQALVILYNSGRAYQYLSVPVETYRDLMEASSKGRYVLDHVMDHYPFAVFKGWNNLRIEARPKEV